MRVLETIRLATLVLGLAGPAAGQDVQDVVIYENRDWSVHRIDWPGEGLFCVAAVELEESSFSIWMNREMTGMLRFQSLDWALDTEAGEVVLEVDNRGKWTMNGARFDRNVIWFVLYESDLSDKLIRHVAIGNTAKLYNKGGKLIESWPLAGSSASIDELRTCVAALPGDVDANPFD